MVAIDGPSGSGKSTLAAGLARRLGWHYLDSGALYRCLAMLATDPPGTDDDDGLRALAARIGGDARFEDGRLWLGEALVDPRLRNEQVADAASRLAPRAVVREALLPVQRGFARAPGLVAEGRDMGSVVFPDAIAKYYLTAASDTRARRRRQQTLNATGDAAIMGGSHSTEQALQERDERDRARTLSPLREAQGAFRIDSSSRDAKGVLAMVMEHLSGIGLVPAAVRQMDG